MSLIFATQLTVVATAAVALLAIVAAIFAFVTYVLSGSRVRVDARFQLPGRSPGARYPRAEHPSLAEPAVQPA